MGKDQQIARRVAHDGQVSISAAPGNDDVDLSAAVLAAQQGDEDAFRLLYRAIQPGLIRYLWVHAGDAAEDLAAETWLRVARDIGRFSGDEAGFRGWVTTIGRHRVLDHLRQQGRRPHAGSPVEVLVGMAASDDTEGAAMDAIATADALKTIAGLPTGQAEAVLLTVVMELDAKAAGRVMGKRAGAVRVAAHRGLRRLAEQLGTAEANGSGGGVAGADARVGRKVPQKSEKRVTALPGATVRDVR
jgi:RNA polymerase sigma-70 factor (ECF subfamily)